MNKKRKKYLCDMCTVLSNKRVYHNVQPTEKELDLFNSIKEIKIKKKVNGRGETINGYFLL